MRISKETRKKIKNILIDDEIRLTTVADEMGMGLTCLSNRLGGRYHFKKSEMEQFAKCLGKTVEEVFGELV